MGSIDRLVYQNDPVDLTRLEQVEGERQKLNDMFDAISQKNPQHNGSFATHQRPVLSASTQRPLLVGSLQASDSKIPSRVEAIVPKEKDQIILKNKLDRDVKSIQRRDESEIAETAN